MHAVFLEDLCFKGYNNCRTHPRLFLAMAVIIVMFVLTDVLSAVDTDGFQDAFFYTTLASVAIISSGVSVFQVSHAFQF